jgi:hypothetical protein
MAMCVGYAVTWLAPIVPPPAPTSGNLRRFLYALVNKIAGNVGGAANANAPAIPMPLQPPRVLGMLLVCGLALTLTACGATTPAPATGATRAAPAASASSNPLTTVTMFTAADLAQAIHEAQQATPPDTEAVACFQFIQANLTTLNGQAGNVQTPAGVFSAFETANLALNGAGSALSPLNKTAAETACGPLALHVQNAAVSVAQEVAALLGVLGIKVAVPALAAVP